MKIFESQLNLLTYFSYTVHCPSKSKKTFEVRCTFLDVEHESKIKLENSFLKIYFCSNRILFFPEQVNSGIRKMLVLSFYNYCL
jgi:hypothetical protein